MLLSGNFEYDAHPREVERLFDKYGPLERVDMKTGEAPCYGNREISQSGPPPAALNWHDVQPVFPAAIALCNVDLQSHT